MRCSHSNASGMKDPLSWHSTTPTQTRTPTFSSTSSRGSSRECRRVVQLATGITLIARVGRVGEDPGEDVRVGVCVVVVVFQLYCFCATPHIAVGLRWAACIAHRLKKIVDDAAAERRLRRHIAIRFRRRRPTEKIHAIYDGRRGRIGADMPPNPAAAAFPSAPTRSGAIVGSTATRKKRAAAAAAECRVGRSDGCAEHHLGHYQLNSSAGPPTTSRRDDDDDNEIRR